MLVVLVGVGGGGRLSLLEIKSKCPPCLKKLKKICDKFGSSFYCFAIFKVNYWHVSFASTEKCKPGGEKSEHRRAGVFKKERSLPYVTPAPLYCLQGSSQFSSSSFWTSLLCVSDNKQPHKHSHSVQRKMLHTGTGRPSAYHWIHSFSTKQLVCAHVHLLISVMIKFKRPLHGNLSI